MPAVTGLSVVSFEDPAEDHAARRGRLSRLRGLPCPVCALRGLPPSRLAWTGTSLACPAAHGYSSPDALTADLARASAASAWPRAARGRTPRRHPLCPPGAPEPAVIAPEPPAGPARPAVPDPALAALWNRRVREWHRQFQEALEEAVGDWMPPEAAPD